MVFEYKEELYKCWLTKDGGAAVIERLSRWRATRTAINKNLAETQKLNYTMA